MCSGTCMENFKFYYDFLWHSKFKFPAKIHSLDPRILPQISFTPRQTSHSPSFSRQDFLQVFDTPPFSPSPDSLQTTHCCTRKSNIFTDTKLFSITALICSHSIPHPMPHSHSQLCAVHILHSRLHTVLPRPIPLRSNTRYFTLHTHIHPCTAKLHFSLSHSTFSHFTLDTPHLTLLIAPCFKTHTRGFHFLHIKKINLLLLKK